MRIVVIGAGISGLSCAQYLVQQGYRVCVYEKENALGGLMRSYTQDGYLYDIGPHYAYHEFIKKIGLTDDEYVYIPFDYQVFVNGSFIKFPFGIMKYPRYVSSAIGVLFGNSIRNNTEGASFGAYIRRAFGDSIAQDIWLPLIRKWQGVDPEELSVDFADRKLPSISTRLMFNMVTSVLSGGRTFSFGNREKHFTHVYPRKGIQQVCHKICEGFKDCIYLDAPVEEINVKDNRVEAINVKGKEIPVDVLISAIPLPALSGLVRNTDVLEAYRRLRFRNTILLVFFIARNKVMRGVINWFPDKEFTFFRITEPKNAASFVAPQGKTIMEVEITCNEEDHVWRMPELVLCDLVQKQLCQVYQLNNEEIEYYRIHKVPFTSPTYLIGYDALRRNIRCPTGIKNLFLVGRAGQHRYLLIDESYEHARACAQEIIETGLTAETNGDEDRGTKML